MEILKGLLGEDETIYEIVRCAAAPVYVIGPVVEDISRQLDIAGCIEDTLHRMLDAKCTDEQISEVMNTSKIDGDYFFFDGSMHYIDLGYIIYDFYPVSIIDTENHYKRPTHEYVLHYWDRIICQHLEIPDDATDEEILEAVTAVTGINPDEFICFDIRDDASMIAVQHVLDDSIMLILMQKTEAEISSSDLKANANINHRFAISA